MWHYFFYCFSFDKPVFYGLHGVPAKAVWHTDGQTDNWQSDPFVALCFASTTIICKMKISNTQLMQNFVRWSAIVIFVHCCQSNFRSTFTQTWLWIVYMMISVSCLDTKLILPWSSPLLCPQQRELSVFPPQDAAFVWCFLVPVNFAFFWQGKLKISLNTFRGLKLSIFKSWFCPSP